MIVLYLLLLLACVALAISSLVGRARGWTPPVAPPRSEALAAWAALAVAFGISLAITFIPVVSSRSTSVRSPAATIAVEERRTLLESGETVILPLLAGVLAMAAAPIVLTHRRSRYWVQLSGALLLAVLSLLSGFSIGLFLLPVAGLMFFATLAGRLSHPRA